MEQNALRSSVIATLFLGILGISFYFLTQSEAILLDGFFNLIAFIMSLMSLQLVRKLKPGGDEKYPFGYYSHEVLLNVLKSLIILFICAFSLISAVDVLLKGGRPLQVDYAIIYAVIAIIVCTVMAVIQKRTYKKVQTPLLSVEVKNWIINAVISGVVGLAFLGALLLEKTKFSYLIVYIDPVLTAGIILSIILVPIKILRDGIRELMQAAPLGPLTERINDSVEKATADLAIQGNVVRQVRLGRAYYILIHCLVDSKFKVNSVEQLDGYREKINRNLESIEESIIADIIFTSNKSYYLMNNS